MDQSTYFSVKFKTHIEVCFNGFSFFCFNKKLSLIGLNDRFNHFPSVDLN